VLTISAHSTAINPTLTLYQLNPANNFGRTLITSNDDSSGTNTNAFIAYAVPASNYYDILVGTSTAGEVGAYTFEVAASTTLSPRLPGGAPPFGTREWWRNAGASLQRAKF
jgi:hypothetical protein